LAKKTATDLIKDFGEIENLYKKMEAASDKIKPRILELLKEHKQEAFLSKDLATIRTDAPIKFDLDECRFAKVNEQKIIDIFSQLEFNSLIARLKDLPGIDKEAKAEGKFERNQKDFKYKLIQTEDEFKNFFKELKKQTEFAWDTETDSLDEINANLLGMSFCWKEGEAYFIKVSSLKSQVLSDDKKMKSGQDSLFAPKKIETKKEIHPWVEELKSILENSKIKKFGHNLKFDIKVLASHGVEVKGVAFDSMIASYLLNPDKRQHGLDAVVLSELGFSKISKEDLLGSGKKKFDFREAPIEKLSLYACEDADFAFRLVKPLEKKLKEEKLYQLFFDLEIPLIEVLAKIELNGIMIDAKYFKTLDKKLDAGLKALQEKIWKIAGEHFNINSVQQLREILFTKLEISTAGVGKTKTGLTTNAAALEKLKGEHKIIEYILDYRELTKLSTTYVKALPELINQKTGRVHTSFNQAVTGTGRLSSTEPNLQNIPVKTEWGKEIRRGFVAEDGKVLVSLDYSQIELRLAAHFSEDPTMVAAFKHGEDIHLATASAINGVPLDKTTREMRSAAKAINFGLLYGQGPHGLAETTGLSYADAKKFIEAYFKNFSHIKKYIDNSLKQARDLGYVETILGRKRWLPEINSSVAMIAKAAERVAINAPLQGSSADIIKLAMIKIDNLINKKFADEVKMILQVHDELVFEMDKDLVKKVVPAIQEIMSSVVKLKVPLTVDAKVGKNWEQMEKIV
jgi:DNA polymerase-1